MIGLGRVFDRLMERDDRRAGYYWEARTIPEVEGGPYAIIFPQYERIGGKEHLLSELPAHGYRFAIVPARRGMLEHFIDILPGDERVYEHVVHHSVNVAGEGEQLVDKVLIGKVYADGREFVKVVYEDGDWYAFTWEPKDGSWLGTAWHREETINQELCVEKFPARDACRGHMRRDS